MATHWTFGKKVAFGFSLSGLLTLAVGVIGAHALRTVVDAKDEVIDVGTELLVEAQYLDTLIERRSTSIRGYMLTQEPRYLDSIRQINTETRRALQKLQPISTLGKEHLEDVSEKNQSHEQACDDVLERVRDGTTPEELEQLFLERLRPERQALATAIDQFVGLQRKLLKDRAAEGSAAAQSATTLLVGIIVVALACAIAIAIVLTRTLSRQIGAAIGHVQSSSAELHAAANQQATGSREQTTAMTEITTTISELLTTSRQIAESSQRVAQMARQTAESATRGDTTVVSARASLTSIRKQVAQIVDHMLDLGKRSQQIGTVLDIVSELAEQTNILAINATIEASGAGDAGRRFAVVADEIRKLADRVGGSTKEIRSLIDEVRSAVNTTVMATETGSKTVEAGSRQFEDVTSVFAQITELVESTTEAAKEIELSTKQQATAVEQVNLAIANVAQASKETETSSAQTLQTAGQLAELSKDLLKLVRTEPT